MKIPAGYCKVRRNQKIKSGDMFCSGRMWRLAEGTVGMDITHPVVAGLWPYIRRKRKAKK